MEFDVKVYGIKLLPMFDFGVVEDHSSLCKIMYVFENEVLFDNLSNVRF